MDRPLLKPWYRVSLEGGTAVLRYGGSVLEFEGAAAGRLLPHLLPLLDGTRTVDDVVAELGEPVRPAIESALDLLREHRLLTAGLPPGVDEGERRALELLSATDPYGRPPAELRPLLGAASVRVRGSGTAADEVERLLRLSAIGSVEREGWDGPPSPVLTVVAPDPDELPRVGEWNGRALEAGTHWLQVLPFDGLLAAVGPLFVPGESACHECYRLRRSANLTSLRPPADPPASSAPVADAVAASLAAYAALRRLVLGDGAAVGVLLAVELAPVAACTRHVVYRVPRCPACSRAAAQAPPLPWSVDVAA